jgi:hypothetical protein
MAAVGIWVIKTKRNVRAQEGREIAAMPEPKEDENCVARAHAHTQLFPVSSKNILTVSPYILPHWPFTAYLTFSYHYINLAVDRYCWAIRLAYLYIFKLTPWCRVLAENQIVTQLVKKLLMFFCTSRFIIMFSRGCHWTLSWARWNQSIFSHPVSLTLLLCAIFAPFFLKYCNFKVKVQKRKCNKMHFHSPVNEAEWSSEREDISWCETKSNVALYGNGCQILQQ